MTYPGFSLNRFGFARACCSFLPLEGLAVSEFRVLIITTISGPFDSLTLRILIAYAGSLGYIVIGISGGLGLCGKVDDFCGGSTELIISSRSIDSLAVLL